MLCVFLCAKETILQWKSGELDNSTRYLWQRHFEFPFQNVNQID